MLVYQRDTYICKGISPPDSRSLTPAEGTRNLPKKIMARYTLPSTFSHTIWRPWLWARRNVPSQCQGILGQQAKSDSTKPSPMMLHEPWDTTWWVFFFCVMRLKYVGPPWARSSPPRPSSLSKQNNISLFRFLPGPSWSHLKATTLVKGLSAVEAPAMATPCVWLALPLSPVEAASMTFVFFSAGERREIAKLVWYSWVAPFQDPEMPNDTGIVKHPRWQFRESCDILYPPALSYMAMRKFLSAGAFHKKILGISVGKWSVNGGVLGKPWLMSSWNEKHLGNFHEGFSSHQTWADAITIIVAWSFIPIL